MPFVKCTNIHPVRKVKRNYIWLDYAIIKSGVWKNLEIQVQAKRFSRVNKLTLVKDAFNSKENRFDFSVERSLCYMVNREVELYFLRVMNIKNSK